MSERYGVETKYAIRSASEDRRLNELILEYHLEETEEDRAIRLALEQIQDGNKIISVLDVLTKSSSSSSFGRAPHMNLAIAPATERELRLVKLVPRWPHGNIKKMWFEAGSWRYDLPPSISRWPDDDSSLQIRNFRNESSTVVPFVPPRIRREFDLRDKFILWEPETWVTRVDQLKVKRPADPVLLEWLVDDIYIVRAAWELSELELAILAGIHV